MISANAAKSAIFRLSTLRYFPSEPFVVGEVAKMLKAMCESDEALEWVVNVMVTEVGEWQGPVRLRQILCSAFKPKDGIEADQDDFRPRLPAPQERSRLLAGSAQERLLEAPNGVAAPAADETFLAQLRAILDRAPKAPRVGPGAMQESEEWARRNGL